MSRISTEQLINLPKIRIPDDINIHVSQTTEHNNNTQILRSRYTHTQDIDIISIPSFQTLLETMMLNAKVKVISYYFMRRMNINLAKHFDDL